MRRFFIDRSAVVDGVVTVEGELFRHLVTVLRLKPGARLIGPDLAKACLEAFLAAPFEGGRHQARVDKLSQKD